MFMHSSIFPGQRRPSIKFFKQTKCVYSLEKLAEYMKCVCFRDEQSEKPITDDKIYTIKRITAVRFREYDVIFISLQADENATVPTLYGHRQSIAIANRWG